MAKNKNIEYSNYILPFMNPVEMNFDMLFRHYFNFMLRDVFQIFKFEHLPKTVNETFFKYCLFCNGKITFFKLDSGELVALNGVYADTPDLYYIPERMLVTNPKLNKSYQLQRDKKCVVVYCSETDIYNLTERYGGLYSLLCRTATMLADSDLSINVAQKNKRLINILAAEDQNTKESINVVVQKQYAGEPYAVVMKSLIDNVQSVPLTDKSGGNQDILQLIKAHQYILAHFYEALGLQTHDNMKQERLISAEINDNDTLAKFNINDMLCTIQDGLDKVNVMFGTEITVQINPLLLEQKSETKSEKLTEQESESEAEPEELAEQESESEAEPEELAEQESESEAEPEEPTKQESESKSETEPEESAEQEAEINININLQDESSAEINIDTGGDDVEL